MASDPIGAAFNGVFDDEINFAIEQCCKIFADLEGFGEAPVEVGGEGGEEVDIAVGAEVIAEDGAEEGEFGEVPFLAKGF